ncbi:MAG: hypothetical protein IKG11_02715 [Atopobiaceae bacterium]|nr:hypothetical protein [Atopobiaceae bacterium]
MVLRPCRTDVFVEEETAEKVSLKFGVYPCAQRETDIEERFVCAKIAADSVRDNPHKISGFYERVVC